MSNREALIEFVLKSADYADRINKVIETIYMDYSSYADLRGNRGKVYTYSQDGCKYCRLLGRVAKVKISNSGLWVEHKYE